MEKETIPARRITVAEKVSQSGNLLGLNQSEVSQYLMGMKSRVEQVLPKHLTAERIISIAATTIARNPQIAQCTPASLLGSVMQASILGFPPVEALGYCYFVPYNAKKKGAEGKDVWLKEVQFQIGYKGMIDLARRSGKIKTVYAEVVREGDEFNVTMGLEQSLEHKPKFDSSKPLTFVYAVCHYTDGGYNFVVLSKSDIERLRMRSPMQKENPSGAWATDYEAMAKAKALKQLSKYMPLNLDQQMAVNSDEATITPDSFSKDNDGNSMATNVQYVQDAEIVDDADVETESAEEIGFEENNGPSEQMKKAAKSAKQTEVPFL